MKGSRALAILGLVWLLAACRGAGSSGLPSAPAESVSASDVHALAPVVTPAGTDTADVALGLHNAGTTRDRLLGVSCTCATAAEIHGGSAAGDTGPVSGIPLPPDKVVFFGPGGPHIVLLGVTQTLAPGGTVTLSFTFETSAPATATATVAVAATPSPAT